MFELYELVSMLVMIPPQSKLCCFFPSKITSESLQLMILLCFWFELILALGSYQSLQGIFFPFLVGDPNLNLIYHWHRGWGGQVQCLLVPKTFQKLQAINEGWHFRLKPALGS